jgi:hypothetical protein
MGLKRTLLVVAAQLVACSTPPAAKPPLAGAGNASEVGELDLLVAYDVVAPESSSSLLRRVCDETAVPSKVEDSELRCGPFLSRYEAAIWAGLSPGARVESHVAFLEPATVEPWVKLRAPYEREVVRVMTKRLFNKRFALVEFELADDASAAKRLALESTPGFDFGQPDPEPGAEPPVEAPAELPRSELELYQIDAKLPRFVAKLPLRSAYDSSAGFGVFRSEDDVAFVQVVEDSQSLQGKSERLVGWRWSIQGREKLFEHPLTSLVVASTDARLTVTRVKLRPGEVVFDAFELVLELLPGQPRELLLLNEWDSPRYRGVSPLPPIATLGPIEARGSSSETVDVMRD